MMGWNNVLYYTKVNHTASVGGTVNASTEKLRSVCFDFLISSNGHRAFRPSAWRVLCHAIFSNYYLRVSSKVPGVSSSFTNLAFTAGNLKGSPPTSGILHFYPIFL